MAVDIHESKWDEMRKGKIYTFIIDSAADVKDLPNPGEWAALTSMAIDWSTFDVYTLKASGWKKGGEA